MSWFREKLEKLGTPIFQPFPLQEVVLIEKVTKSQLPEQYKSFLIECGAVVFDVPLVFPTQEPNPWQHGARSKFGDFLEAGTGSNSVRRKVRICREHIVPEGLLPIAESPGGNLICIDLAPEANGHIWFWDHESLQPKENCDRRGFESIYSVADNLMDFISRLRVEQATPIETELLQETFSGEFAKLAEKKVRGAVRVVPRKTEADRRLHTRAQLVSHPAPAGCMPA